MRTTYTTKSERSVSTQGHLQPRCHSKARSLSRELQIGLLSHYILDNIVMQTRKFNPGWAIGLYITVFLLLHLRLRIILKRNLRVWLGLTQTSESRVYLHCKVSLMTCIENMSKILTSG